MLFILCGGGGHGQDVNYLPMMSQFARWVFCSDGEVFCWHLLIFYPAGPSLLPILESVHPFSGLMDENLANQLGMAKTPQYNDCNARNQVGNGLCSKWTKWKWHDSSPQSSWYVLTWPCLVKLLQDVGNSSVPTTEAAYKVTEATGKARQTKWGASFEVVICGGRFMLFFSDSHQKDWNVALFDETAICWPGKHYTHTVNCQDVILINFVSLEQKAIIHII